MFKALSIGSFIPGLSSETKTSFTQPRYQRATIMPRSAAAPSRVSSRGILPYVSAGALAISLITLAFHLYMVNAYATKGYELKKHQQAIRELTDKQKYLLVQQSELGSISKVNDVAAFH